MCVCVCVCVCVILLNHLYYLYPCITRYIKTGLTNLKNKWEL